MSWASSRGGGGGGGGTFVRLDVQILLLCNCVLEMKRNSTYMFVMHFELWAELENGLVPSKNF